MHSRFARVTIAFCLLLVVTHTGLAGATHQASLLRLDVRWPAQIVRDRAGIPHVFARTETDMALIGDSVEVQIVLPARKP